MRAPGRPLELSSVGCRSSCGKDDPLAVRSPGEVSGTSHARGWRRALAAQARQRSRGDTDHARRCLDLLWDGNRLFVAGPDTAARWHRSPAGTTFVALRFSGGLGPTLLDVPADELRDRTANLDELWPGRKVRELTEQVEADPATALEAWAVERASLCDQDPLGPRVLAMAMARTPIAVMAERVCMSPRQLHRRCLPAFGYGPRKLSRIMRFQRALEEVRCGVPLAQVAAAGGYADQAHLSREVRALAGTTPRGLLGNSYVDGSGAHRSTGRPSGSWTTA
jgi:AraC-like DNA-binding protein